MHTTSDLLAQDLTERLGFPVSASSIDDELVFQVDGAERVARVISSVLMMGPSFVYLNHKTDASGLSSIRFQGD
ncbi:hypothetical protein KPP23_076 [Pseudomonas phage KPP23]|nr:hypothetical protein KPP23_076 [Pseudomonas phage KPP23]